MKRAFDICAALSALLLLSPLLLSTALLVRIKLGSPVIFSQPRPGRHGRPFSILKFRTMTDRRDEAGNLLLDAERLTPFGRMLRSTSLDELPELINVLKGDMSLVGPRPLLMRYLPYYTERENLRHTIRPGITGWAQINGRNCLGWDDRLALDIWYVEHRSFLLDLSIIFRTVAAVFKREGLVADPRSIMLNLDEERAGRQELSRQGSDSHGT
ncbi:MAG: sugar transferase [Geobacteraceae bacterium]|nr:sugar transferase [Geobacteraceae bacterium]